ncbi:hypothetical protein CEXT_665591 [Caerostris extrusa]|uniref:Uncharacterized protein n=1 Tax=Caerostris extrusa TaxID=172846 RepID=A0AAV4XM08_CAEEX|nr:hypothetical protein CEXT_665591 [Caerostris extrusa]
MPRKVAQWREWKTVRGGGKLRSYAELFSCFALRRRKSTSRCLSSRSPGILMEATLLDIVSDNNPIMQDILDCCLHLENWISREKIRIFYLSLPGALVWVPNNEKTGYPN